MSSSSRCAACRSLRRRCSEDCVLAPYFPASDPQRFERVHKIFGAGNVSRMLQQLPVEKRRNAADAISDEAYMRYQDPIYGAVGFINQLFLQIDTTRRELAETEAQIAMHTTHFQHQHQQQSQVGIGVTQQPSEQSRVYDLDQTFSGFYFPPNFP